MVDGGVDGGDDADGGGDDDGGGDGYADGVPITRTSRPGRD